MAKQNITAVAYFRTSSATNVNGDSLPRQQDAVNQFAKATGYEIVEEFYDPAVSGEDHIEARPGFSALLDRVESNGVATVLVEHVDRFARNLLTQELAIVALNARRITVLDSSGNDLTDTDDPTKVAMRQVAGAFAQLEKSRLVARLKRGRERKRAETGRCEGRRPVPDEVVKAAKRLARQNPRTHKRRSLRAIAAELAELGYFGPSSKPYEAGSIKHMLAH